MNICKCGCGELTRKNNIYIHGHNGKNTIKLKGKENPLHGRKRPKEVGEKISLKLTGKKLSLEHIEKIKLTKKYKHSIGEIVPWNKGKTNVYTKEQIEKMSKSSKKRCSNPKEKERLKIISQKACEACKTESYKKKLSNVMKGKIKTESHKKALSKSLMGHLVSEETKNKIRIKRLLQVFPMKDTSIEIKMQKILVENNIPFKTHVPLIGQPDIFIEPTICIFCDGDYWHNRDFQVKRDDKINLELINKGYKVLRFWESEINSDINQCLDRIKKIIEEI